MKALLGRMYHAFVDMTDAVMARLFELPLFVILIVAFVGFAVAVVILRSIAKTRPWVSGSRLRITAVVYGVLLFILALDYRFERMQLEIRGLRKRLPDATAVAAGRPPAPARTKDPKDTSAEDDLENPRDAIERIRAEARKRRKLKRIDKPDSANAIKSAKMKYGDRYVDSTAALGIPNLEVALEEQQGPGIVYKALRGLPPREVMGHLTIVDLTEPTIDVRITKEFPKKRSTSGWAKENDCIVAINGEAGESPGAQTSLGVYGGNWVVRGTPVMLADTDRRPFIAFDKNNRARYSRSKEVENSLKGDMYNVIWGRWDLVINGKVHGTWSGMRSRLDQPRTVMGVDKQGATLYLLVIDGRQRGYSLGASMEEAGRIIVAAGAHNAMGCDQGGSSCMYLKSRKGLVSTPSDNSGRERSTFSHFGISYKK